MNGIVFQRKDAKAQRRKGNSTPSQSASAKATRILSLSSPQVRRGLGRGAFGDLISSKRPSSPRPSPPLRRGEGVAVVSAWSVCVFVPLRLCVNPEVPR